MAPEVIACETTTEEMYGSSADIWSLGMLCLLSVTYLMPKLSLHHRDNTCLPQRVNTLIRVSMY